ncbi:tail fiber assembly protein [Pseudomonas brenneri]|uniref:tail fiber assembly protein n=1 Tax=Pseudomonas brenneri TaxID=129817 RepID=UPI003571447A
MEVTFEHLDLPEYPSIPERLPKPAYSYRQDTGEYVGETTADPDQLVADNWLIPAQATLVPPPAMADGEAAVWSVDRWVIVQDVRGIKFLKSDGQAVQWADLGPMPDSLTDLPYPGEFHAWDGDSWKLDDKAELKSVTANALMKRDGLLAFATLRIAPLQDAVDIDDATASDIAMLKKWKQYRVALNRIEQQAEFPLNIEWPVVPS